MKLKYTGGHSLLKVAVEFTNQILVNPVFYSEINNCNKFDNTNLSSSEIASRIYAWEKPVIIKTYWNPFGSANAKTGSSRFISINTAKLKRSKKSIINTLVHEYVHAVDFGEDGKLEFTHADNHNGG